MDVVLSAPAVRVLGCLMEKEMATPDYYPLSLNALVTACNQKTNRDPVVEYDEATVLAAIDELKVHQLAFRSDSGRVPKYGENFIGRHKFIAQEAAVLTMLFLRGPQTAGELRNRTERLYAFSSVDEVTDTLDNLAELGLVRRLPRRPGQKESRYCHLLAGEPADVADQPPTAGAAPPTLQEILGRQEQLAAEVARLREELASLAQAFAEFKAQFE